LILIFVHCNKKKLIIAVCLHSKFNLNWLTGNKKNIAACYLKDLLEIKSSENSPNDKQQAVDLEDNFLIIIIIKKIN